MGGTEATAWELENSNVVSADAFGGLAVAVAGKGTRLGDTAGDIVASWGPCAAEDSIADADTGDETSYAVG